MAKKRIIYWVTALLVVFITFWFGHVWKPAEKPVEEKRVPIEVEAVKTSSIEETIELSSWIKANQVVDVKSKLPGRIESLQVVTDDNGSVPLEEGLVVRKGQQLCVIDHDVYLAQVAVAKANLRAGEVELADAEREKKRIVALYEGGSATEQNKDKAVTAVELAKARLSSAKANLELAEINLRESTIVSPIDGVVIAKHIDQGNLVGAGNKIVTIADVRLMKIIVAVAERNAAQVMAGTPAKIRIDAFGEKEFNTKVYSVYPALDPQTHTIQVEIRLKNDQLLLKPGMFARVTLITKHKDNVVVVSRDVVLGGKVGKHYVYVVESGQSEKDDSSGAKVIACKRFIEVGITQGERYEITSGLDVGETLVVNGMNYLTDGIDVDVVRIKDIK